MKIELVKNVASKVLKTEVSMDVAEVLFAAFKVNYSKGVFTSADVAMFTKFHEPSVSGFFETLKEEDVINEGFDGAFFLTDLGEKLLDIILEEFEKVTEPKLFPSHYQPVIWGNVKQKTSKKSTTSSGEFPGIEGHFVIDADSVMTEKLFAMRDLDSQHGAIPAIDNYAFKRNHAVFIKTDDKIVYLGVLKNCSKRKWFIDREYANEDTKTINAKNDNFWRFYINGAPSKTRFAQGSVDVNVEDPSLISDLETYLEGMFNGN